MRPKITFRRGREIRREPHASQGGWIADYAKPDDKELENDTLRKIVWTWRMIYGTDSRPAHQDIKATLERLSRLSDDDAVQALRVLDTNAESLLSDAALAAPPRRARERLRRVNLSSWSAKQIRAYAARALAKLPRMRGGRPQLQLRHTEYARELLNYWNRTHERRATLSREFETPFSSFAADMFRRVDFDLSRRQLHRILSEAKKLTG